MPEYWKKLQVWVAGLPWYFKWVGFIILGLALLAAIFSWAFRMGPKERTLEDLDGWHIDEIKRDLAVLEREEAKLKADIGEKKRAIAKALNQAHNIDSRTMAARDKITKATTMEELDALQKELGL